jgi:hypothetical protein
MIGIDHLASEEQDRNRGRSSGATKKIPSVSDPFDEDGTMGPATALKSKSTWISLPRGPQKRGLPSEEGFRTFL